MFRYSGMLVVALVLVGCSCVASGAKSKTVSKSKVGRNNSGKTDPRVKQRVDFVLLPVEVLTGGSKHKENKGGSTLVERNKNGNEKFWGGTEVVLSPEGDGKLPVIIKDKVPYHDIVHSGGMPPFFKKKLLPMMMFFVLKTLLVFPMKFSAIFVLVILSGFVGLIALVASVSVFGLMVKT